MPVTYAPGTQTDTALLEKNNYAVDAVYDGAEACYLEAGNYDALVLDIMMPK